MSVQRGKRVSKKKKSGHANESVSCNASFACSNRAVQSLQLHVPGCACGMAQTLPGVLCPPATIPHGIVPQTQTDEIISRNISGYMRYLVGDTFVRTSEFCTFCIVVSPSRVPGTVLGCLNSDCMYIIIIILKNTNKSEVFKFDSIGVCGNVEK